MTWLPTWLRRGFRPHYPPDVPAAQLVSAAADFFSLPAAQVAAWHQEYLQFTAQQGYVQRFGEAKTLCSSEAFLCYVAFIHYRPQTLAEIGTQAGKSTRRLLDMAVKLQLPRKVVCFDIVDELEFCSRDEAELVLQDVTGHAAERVFAARQPQFVFLDARPYALLKDVITSFLAAPDCHIMAIHDCGRGICNPQMTVARDNPGGIDSSTGVWERHVLAEIFGVADPRDPALDDRRTATHHLRIFPTPHGLALIRRLPA